MIQRILDRRTQCDDGNHQGRNEKILGITLHMFGVVGVHDAAGIAEFYRANPQYTGGQMPYTYVVLASGVIELALPLWEVGPHAMRWSHPSVGVTFIGDFNKHPPLFDQWNAGTDLVAELTVAVGSDDVQGHTERPRSTRDSRKVCPGKLFDLDRFRSQSFGIRREGAAQRLSTALVAA